MSLTSRIINAKPTKVSKNYCHDCQMSLLSVARLVFSVLDIRENTVKTRTQVVRTLDIHTKNTSQQYIITLL